MFTTSMTPEKALAGFGLGCAQHVFGEFAPQLGLDRDTALRIAALFGSGMFEGATWGPVICLFMGYFADMSFVENSIFFLLLLPVLSLLSAFVSQFFINRRFFAFMGITLAELLITALLQMLKTLAGDAWSSDMLFVVVFQTLWSMPFSALAYFLPERWSRS